MASKCIMNHDSSPLLLAHANTAVTLGDEYILLVLAGSSCRILIDHGDDSAEPVTLNENNLAIASAQRVSVILSNNRPYRLVDSNRLCRMLAFVDTALPISPPHNPSSEGLSLQEVPDDIAQNVLHIEHWLTLEAMRGNRNNVLLNCLRRQEAYHLTTYLLSYPDNCAHLNDLCVHYGLSYSHFRRLCHRALGSPVKPRLREWRAARAMLDLLVGERSVLEVALGNGYASASHISTDIKQLFGITPRMAKNACSLLP